jgi:phosphoribosylformylglycinamidine (FGAM) synthase-like enzyme
MLGILDDVTAYMGMGFANEGDEVFVLGSYVEQPQSLGGSEYLRLQHGLEAVAFLSTLRSRSASSAPLSPPSARVRTACHDCSDGGLAVHWPRCAWRG